MSSSARTIAFPNGSSAVVVEVPPDASGEELLVHLGLPTPRGTLVVNGSTADLSPANRARVVDSLVNGVGHVALSEGLTVVTGGTDAGIFAVLGAALEHGSAPLVGVAPAHLVTWPGHEQASDDPAPLEAHHSHFVLVDGDQWGDETGALLALVASLGTRAPCVAVLCGGGALARKEALAHCRAGRELVVVAGSGRLADELAEAAQAPALAHDPETAEMLATGHVTVCPPEANGRRIAATLREALVRDRA